MEHTRTETTHQTKASATLLVAAEVPAWHSVVIEHAIQFEDLDEEIGKLATAAGMDIAGRFPFLLEGDFEDLQWHVIDGSRLTAGGSHEDHLDAAEPRADILKRPVYDGPAVIDDRDLVGDLLDLGDLVR